MDVRLFLLLLLVLGVGALVGCTPKVQPVPAPLPSTVPSSKEIERVISSHKGDIKLCYERALAHDTSLVKGRMSARLSIAPSGQVEKVALTGTPAFRALEPCAKQAILRWAFPPASDPYGTEFPLIFQGNE
jgi:hypothetical protein